MGTSAGPIGKFWKKIQKNSWKKLLNKNFKNRQRPHYLNFRAQIFGEYASSPNANFVFYEIFCSSNFLLIKFFENRIFGLIFKTLAVIDFTFHTKQLCILGPSPIFDSKFPKLAHFISDLVFLVKVTIMVILTVIILLMSFLVKVWHLVYSNIFRK